MTKRKYSKEEFDGAKKYYSDVHGIDIAMYRDAASNIFVDIWKKYYRYNHSFVEYIFSANTNRYGKISNKLATIDIDGKKISYKKLHDKVYEYARKFKNMGIDENSTVPICMSPRADYTICLMALRLVGADVFIFDNASSDSKKKIIEQCKSKNDKKNSKWLVICDEEHKESLQKHITGINILVFGDKSGEAKYTSLDNNVKDFKDCEEAEECVYKWYKKPIIYSMSSGTTGEPKVMAHYIDDILITMAEFELKKYGRIFKLNALDFIYNSSNTGTITSLLERLAAGGWGICYADGYSPDALMEAIYNENKKPNYIIAPRQLLVEMAFNILYNPDEKYDDYRRKKVPWTSFVLSVGEPTSPGEQKLINRWLRSARASVFGLAPALVGSGGGSCEYGGYGANLRDANDLEIYDLARVVVIDPNAKPPHEVPDGQVGVLAIQTPTGMIGYDVDFSSELKKGETRRIVEVNGRKFYINDDIKVDGEDFHNLNVWGRKDFRGHVKILGRYGHDYEYNCDNGKKIVVPLPVIEEAILRDTKNILSCSVVSMKNDTSDSPSTDNNDYSSLVACITLMPRKKGMRRELTDSILAGIYTRVYNSLIDFYSNKYNNSELPCKIAKDVIQNLGHMVCDPFDEKTRMPHNDSYKRAPSKLKERAKKDSKKPPENNTFNEWGIPGFEQSSKTLIKRQH